MSAQRASRARRERAISTMGWIIALALLLAVILPTMGSMTHGFISYYTASHLLRHGELNALGYDNDWFGEQVRRVSGQPIREVMTYNPPTFALLALPLTLLPPQSARDLWGWISLLILIASLALLARITIERTGVGHRPLLLAFAICLPALLANFRLGQFYILLLALFVIALWALDTNRGWLAGICLGLALVLKSSGLPIWLLLLVHRRWGALLSGTLTVLVVIAASLPWFGMDIWRRYPSALSEAVNSPLVTVTVYQTTYSFLSHMFRYDAEWNPYPIADLPAVPSILHALVAVASIVLTAARSRWASIPSATSAFLCLSILLVPVAEAHHYLLLLIPIATVLKHMASQVPEAAPSRAEAVLMAAVAVLLIVPIPAQTSSITHGWYALLAYPRLYGAWLLWAVCVRQMSAAAEGSPTARPA